MKDLTQYCIDFIKDQFGDVVRVTNVPILKFGKTGLASTTSSTVQVGGGTEVLISANSIDTVSSSNANDDQIILVRGHTVDLLGLFTFVEQLVTLDGQNKVTLDTPLARSERIYNTNDTLLVGTIYCYEDDTVIAGVPQTTDKIHCIVQAGDQQSYKAASTCPDNIYYLIHQWYGSLLEKTSSFADFTFQQRTLTSSFRPDISLGTNGAPIVYPFDPCLIVRPNTDLKVTVVADGPNTSVTAGFSGIVLTKLSESDTVLDDFTPLE